MPEGRTVVVTGISGSATIAYGIASAFAGAGWDVACVGRHMKRTSQAAKEIASQVSTRVEPFVFDESVDDAEQASARLAERIAERLGNVSALINASQAAKVGDKLQATKLADLACSLDTGLVASYLLMRAFYPQLAQNKGLVVNLLSAGAEAGQPGLSLLAASKEGLRGLSRVAANEWAQDGIRVECLEPQVRTRAFEKWVAEYPEAAAEFGDLESIEGFAARVLALTRRDCDVSALHIP